MYLFQLALTAVCFPSLAGGLGKTISSLWELTPTYNLCHHSHIFNTL